MCACLVVCASASAAGCFATPSACGYPDATNTGVPAGTVLTPSSSRTVTTNGTVLNALDITGTVVVAADNVTIKNSRITATKGGSGTYAVILNNGADNFTIEHTEVLGPTSETAGIESAVWNHYGNPGVVARYDYFHKCADCWEGSGVFENDYMVVDAAYTGSHDEDIYVCGAAVDVEHSTIYNTHHQTATVFGDTASCGGNEFDIHNSLLAGGGYMLYPQSAATSSVGEMNITGNRFARCLNGNVYNSATGGTYCSSTSGDSNGYYPYGGFYGLAAYYFTGGVNVWSNNVWDDNNKPVCPTGAEGCGVATPPPTGPPPSEEPVVESPTEEPPAEKPVEKPTQALEAIFSIPGEVLSNVPTVLNGTESTGPGSLSCKWSIETATATKSLSGCLTAYTPESPGSVTVKLTVRSSQGGSDSSRRLVEVKAPLSGVGSPAATAKAPPQSAIAAVVAAVHQATATPVPDARGAWSPPNRVRPGHRLKLLAAVAAESATCAWTVVEPNSRRHRRTVLHGCSASLRAPAAGKLKVRLTISTAEGEVSTVRRTIAVAPR